MPKDKNLELLTQKLDILLRQYSQCSEIALKVFEEVRKIPFSAAIDKNKIPELAELGEDYVEEYQIEIYKKSSKQMFFGDSKKVILDFTCLDLISLHTWVSLQTQIDQAENIIATLRRATDGYKTSVFFFAIELYYHFESIIGKEQQVKPLAKKMAAQYKKTFTSSLACRLPKLVRSSSFEEVFELTFKLKFIDILKKIKLEVVKVRGQLADFIEHANFEEQSHKDEFEQYLKIEDPSLITPEKINSLKNIVINYFDICFSVALLGYILQFKSALSARSIIEEKLGVLTRTANVLNEVCDDSVFGL